MFRSPMISSRCPRPIGIAASMASTPVHKVFSTFRRSMISGAGRNNGSLSPPKRGGPSSSGLPKGSRIRPSASGPTPSSGNRPVPTTPSPSQTLSRPPKSTAPNASVRKSNAIPNAPESKASSSSNRTSGRPDMNATPSPTVRTTPRGLSASVKSTACAARFNRSSMTPSRSFMAVSRFGFRRARRGCSFPAGEPVRRSAKARRRRRRSVPAPSKSGPRHAVRR